MDEIEKIAADIAAKGLAHAAELEATATRMRQLLADPTFLTAQAEAQLRAEQEKFDWEAEETFPPGVRPKIWAAKTCYYATGEGLTTYYYATYARSAAEFRRKFARRVGAGLVDVAQLSDPPRGSTEKWSGGKAQPGAFSIFVEQHINYA